MEDNSRVNLMSLPIWLIKLFLEENFGSPMVQSLIILKQTLKLDTTYPLTMTQREENSRAVAILTVVKTSPVARSNDDDKFLTKLPHYYSAFLHRCKKARHFFLKFLLLFLLMSPHGHVNSQINQESTTALLEGCKLVRDAVSTRSSLSTERFESKPPSRVQANHHLILRFLLIPVRLKDSSTIFAQTLKLPESATAVYQLQEHRNIPHPDS